MTIVTTGFGATLAARRSGVRSPAPRRRSARRASRSASGTPPRPGASRRTRSRPIDSAAWTSRSPSPTYERLAEERLEPGAFGYFAGGAGDERTLARERRGVARAGGCARACSSTSTTVSTATTVLGTPVSMPLLVAPTAYPADRASGRRARDGARGRRGGDGACASRRSPPRRPAEVAAAAPGRAALVPALRLPRPRRHARAVEQAVERGLRRDRAHGRRAAARPPRARPPHRLPRPGGDRRAELAARRRLGGGDAARAARRDRPDARPGTTSPSCARSSPLPVVVKGIQTGEDAVLAVRARRRRDRRLEPRRPPARRRRAHRSSCCPRSSRRSPAGSRCYVDGGIRRGTDVVTALALGARAVLAGRAPLWGLAARRGGRARAACSSCSATRSSSRSHSAAAARPTAVTRGAPSVESAARERRRPSPATPSTSCPPAGSRRS